MKDNHNDTVLNRPEKYLIHCFIHFKYHDSDDVIINLCEAFLDFTQSLSTVMNKMIIKYYQSFIIFQ